MTIDSNYSSSKHIPTNRRNVALALPGLCMSRSPFRATLKYPAAEHLRGALRTPSTHRRMHGSRGEIMKRLMEAASLALIVLKTTTATGDSTLAGVGGVALVDSGIMVVSGPAQFARTEGFEFVQRRDGGVSLLNTITASDGRFRVRARFDYDDAWNSISANGTGLYDGKPVISTMRVNGTEVDIRVIGDGIDITRTAACDPDCFVNMSPSAIAMFVMTRHYDEAEGGAQTFRWAGQDLDRVRTLTGGTATLSFEGEGLIPRDSGLPIRVKHYTFAESLPVADGHPVILNFDLWTRANHAPLGFRVQTPGATSDTLGFRQGYDDVRDAILKSVDGT
jgi:hypothetical protein